MLCVNMRTGDTNACANTCDHDKAAALQVSFTVFDVNRADRLALVVVASG